MTNHLVVRSRVNFCRRIRFQWFQNAHCAEIRPEARSTVWSFASSGASTFAPPLPPPHFSRVSHTRIEIHAGSILLQTRRGQNCLDYRLVKSAVASADWEMLWSGACGLARPQLEVRRRRRRLTAPWSVARATGSYSQAADSGNVAGFSTPPPRNLSPKARGAYLRRSSTLPVSNFGFQSRSTDACGRQLTIQVHQTTAPPYTLTSHSPSRILVQGPDHPNVKLHRRYPSQRHLR
jgi:hypothetical protein